MRDDTVSTICHLHFAIEFRVGRESLPDRLTQPLSHRGVPGQAARRIGRTGFGFDIDRARTGPDHDHRVAGDLVGSQKLGQGRQGEVEADDPVAIAQGNASGYPLIVCLERNDKAGSGSAHAPSSPRCTRDVCVDRSRSGVPSRGRVCRPEHRTTSSPAHRR